MPTRYTLDVELKGVVSGEVVDDSSKKTDANKVRGELRGVQGGVVSDPDYKDCQAVDESSRGKKTDAKKS